MIKTAASTVVLAAFEGHTLTTRETQFYRHFPVSGVTLFKRNIPYQWTQLQSTLDAWSRHLSGGHVKPIIAIDQEGGRVNRMPPGFPNLGPALKLAAGRSDAKALDSIEIYGKRVARELRACGINVNFAPVCDVLTKHANVAIGDRAFGTDPHDASLRSQAFLKGLQSEKVWGCLKHFPGQGDANADTHLTASSIHTSQKTMQSRELLPFRENLSQAAMVMISHCIFTDYDHKPASLSRRIQTDLLRQRMGYKGLILSDDMNMHALSQDPEPWVHSLLQAILAGTDLVLICRDVDRIELAISGIIKEAYTSFAFKQRLLDAASRVMRFRAKL